MFKLSTTFVALTAAIATLAAPTLVARHEGHDHRAGDSTLSSNTQRTNALEAQKMNSRFASLKATEACQSGEQACIDGGFAQCVAGKWVVRTCAPSTRCYALPLELAPGTAIACDTQGGATARFDRAGVTGGTKGDGAAPPSDDDDEVPFCDEDEEDEANEVRDVPEHSVYKYFYRRQAPVESDPVTLATLPLSGSAPSATVEATPSSTSNAVVTPTVVIGSDGIVTVTIVSTVFATPTDCASAGSGTVTPIVVSTARPSSLPSSSVEVQPLPSSASLSASVSSGSSVAASTSTLILNSPVPTASTSSVVPRGGGFNFSSDAPAPAAAVPTPGGYY